MINTGAVSHIILRIGPCAPQAWSGNGIFNYGDGQSIVGPSLIDFAGSGVVHLVGGIGALTGAIFVGPRKGLAKHVCWFQGKRE